MKVRSTRIREPFGSSTRRRDSQACFHGTTRLAVVSFVFGIAFLAVARPASTDGQTTDPEPPGTIEFVGKNLFGTANGIFHEWQILESSIDLDNPAESYAIVEIDLKSLDTGNGRRDNHLRDPDFFETETYPTATARVHSLRPVTDEDRGTGTAENETVAESGADRFEISIDLDLHGIEKTVLGTARLISRVPLSFEGETTIDRTEFGVGPRPSRWNPTTPRAQIPVRFRAILPE